MKKFYSLAAAFILSASCMTAQTMTITIEGKEVKNGANIIVDKAPKETKLGALTLYDFGVNVTFKTSIDQTVETKGDDLDKKTPGLACCPTGFTCTTANAGNNWTSTGTMTNLTAGQEVNGEWIHYNYNQTKPTMGEERKSVITFRGKNETISFTLTMKVADATAIKTASADKQTDAKTYNAAGQRVNGNAKGLIIRNGKKYIVK